MKYFTIDELTKSATAWRWNLNNTPPLSAVARLTALAENVLDPLREAWGAPIVVTSGFRSVALNKVVGGVKNSQHLTGEAADIRALSARPDDNKKIFLLAQKIGIPFDQLIDERGYQWVHISYSKDRQRRQILHL